MREFGKILSMTFVAAAVLLLPATPSHSLAIRPGAATGAVSAETVQYYPGVRGGYGVYGGYRPYWRPSPRYYGGIYGGVGPYWGPGLTVVVPAYPAVRPYYRPVYPTTRRVYRRAVGVPAHVSWCSARYRSYRAWDNTFQPYYGPRRLCISPYR
jgi:hypothetical protein